MISHDRLVSLSDLIRQSDEQPLDAPKPDPARTGPDGPWRAGWLALLAALAARAVLALLGGLLLWSLAPAVSGWHPTVVMTGSMQPRLHPGDVVIARPIAAGKVRVGQVLLVTDPDTPGRLRLHRLAEIDPMGRLILRGDANSANDSSPVARSAVHGVAVLRIPDIGVPMLWIRQGNYLDIMILAGSLAVLVTLAASYQSVDVVQSASRRRRRAGPAGRRVVAGLVLLSLTSAELLHPTPARAKTIYVKTTADAGNTWSAPQYFSCRQAVLATSPFLYFQLNESSGATAADSSGNNNAGAYSSTGIGYSAPGACGYDRGTAVTLDGSSGLISTATQVNNPVVFTTEIWFKTTTTNGGRLIGLGSSQTGASGSFDRHIYLTGAGQVLFGIYTGGYKTIISKNRYNDGGWHLADATFSASTGMQLYLDGQLVASNATVTTDESYTGYWRIGYENMKNWPSAPTNPYFAGAIDDAAVYTTVLTAAQISSHYAAGA